MFTTVKALLVLALSLNLASGLKIYMNDLDSLIYDSKDIVDIREDIKYEETNLRAITRFIFVSEPNEFYGAPKINNSDNKFVKSFKIINTEFSGNLDPLYISEAISGPLTLVMDVEYVCTDADGSDTFTFNLETFEFIDAENVDDEFDDIIMALDNKDLMKQLFKSSSNINFKWTKECSKRFTHTGVNIIVEDDEFALTNGIPETPFVYNTQNEDIYIVEKYSTTTLISIQASEGTSFAWNAPKIETPYASKTDKIKLHASGALSVPGYLHSEDQGDSPSLVLFYDECDVESAVIRLTWDIPGYNHVYIEFIKRCGSKVHKDLSIKMSSPSGVFDAVTNGKVQEKFAKGKFFLSSSTQETTFKISTTSAPVTVSRVLVSQSPTTFRSSLTGSVNANSGATITDNGSVTLKFDCSVQGTSKTTVTFVLDGYEQLDVSFAKQCSPKNAKLKSNRKSVGGSIYGTSWLVL